MTCKKKKFWKGLKNKEFLSAERQNINVFIKLDRHNSFRVCFSVGNMSHTNL